MMVASTMVPPGDFQSSFGVDLGKQLIAQMVFLWQAAEVQYRGFVRRGLAPQIDADKGAHGQRVIECLFPPPDQTG
jgi:hypothetical protein